MPLPAGQPEATPVDVTAAPDGVLIAIGTTGGDNFDDQYPVAWRSIDGGQRWTIARLPTAKGTQLSAVVATGGGFTAVGRRYATMSAVVLDSTNGNRWSVDRSAAEAGAHALAGAVALPGGTLLAAAATGSATGSRSDQQCAAAWRRAPSGVWTQQNLGCHGIPTALAVLSDGRIAAAFWHTLWLSRARPGRTTDSRHHLT